MSTADAFNNAMAGEDNFNNDYFAGPFKIESFDKSQQVVTLVPNDKWWGEKPLLEKVTFRVLDAAAQATAFANKTLDVIDYIISADVYQQCIGREDAEVRQNYGLQWRHFTLNGSTGVLADKAVRQALLRACNRQAIAESDLAGLPVPVSPPRERATTSRPPRSCSTTLAGSRAATVSVRRTASACPSPSPCLLAPRPRRTRPRCCSPRSRRSAWRSS